MRMRRNTLRDDEAAPQGDYTNEKKYIFIYILALTAEAVSSFALQPRLCMRT